MNRPTQHSLVALVLGFVSFPAISASGQVAEIIKIPNQVDRANAYLYSGVPVEAANGDLLVFYVDSGMYTNERGHTYPGTSAQLMLTRSSDGGVTWSAADTIRSAMDEFGTEGIWNVRVFKETTGRIFLTFGYKYALPYTAGIETYYSDDSGVSWLLASENTDANTIGVSVLSSTAILGLKYDWDWDTGRFDYLTSISTDLGASWSAPAMIIQGGWELCDWFLYAAADMEWTFVYSTCYSSGPTNKFFQMKTTDAGATWTNPVQIMTSEVSRPATYPAVTLDSDGSLWLSYASGNVISYRKRTDGGDTWSEATDWTAGDDATLDWRPSCAPSTHGPMCVFLGIRESTHHQNHFGFLGQSVDPRAGHVGIQDEARKAELVSLRQNYPNPFRGSTTIEFAVDEPTRAHLAVYDLLGREVAVLVDGQLAAGVHRAVWNAAGVSHGVYFYRLTATSAAESRRLILAN